MENENPPLKKSTWGQSSIIAGLIVAGLIILAIASQSDEKTQTTQIQTQTFHEGDTVLFMDGEICTTEDLAKDADEALAIRMSAMSSISKKLDNALIKILEWTEASEFAWSQTAFLATSLTYVFIPAKVARPIGGHMNLH